MTKIDLEIEDSEFQTITIIGKKKGISAEAILQELLNGAIESYLEDSLLPSD